MEISGEHHIPVPRGQVWEALNNPAVLQASIPGCESLEKVSDTTFTASVVSKIGSIKARFKGKVDFTDIVPLSQYTISGQGQGGMAGSVKGTACVELEDYGPKETLLRYTAKAALSGKLASVGSRIIEGVVRNTADDFFCNFVEEVSGVRPAAAKPTTSVNRLVWVIVAGILVAAAAIAFMVL
jgi:hypothetical protein